MAYLPLARKWRPQDFASLIGQEPVVTALRNALSEGRIAQAYLFSGIRGVGKTTAARLLAKALNCEQGPTPEPCNECPICIEITSGADLDVLEVDAATYSKVEQVRDLTESLRYGAARDRYKVVILDEVHRLSRQAFDALLKIVEEPPPHLVFIFATTEIEAVPATILSRCQEFLFRRVAAGPLTDHLTELCQAEEIEASPAALRLVARAGEGSVRDAVSLLDQLATYGGGRVADSDAARLFGGFDPDLFHRLLGAVLSGDGATVTTVVGAAEQDGRDPRHLYTRFLSYVRDALHLALGAEDEPLVLPPDEADRLRALVVGVGYENLLRLLNQLLASETVLRRSEVGFLALEISLLKATELPRLIALESLVGGGVAPSPGAAHGAKQGGPTGPTGRPTEDPDEAAPRSSAAPPTEPPPEEGPEAEPAAPPRPSGGSGRSDVTDPSPAPPADEAPPEGSEPAEGAPSPTTTLAGGGAVDAFLNAVARRRQVLAAHLAESDGVVFDDGTLSIVRKPDDHRLERALQRDANRRAISEAVNEVWGPDARWGTVEGNGLPPAPAPNPGVDAAEVGSDPRVQAVLDVFSGSVRRIEPSAPKDER